MQIFGVVTVCPASVKLIGRMQKVSVGASFGEAADAAVAVPMHARAVMTRTVVTVARRRLMPPLRDC